MTVVEKPNTKSRFDVTKYFNVGISLLNGYEIITSVLI